MAAQDYAQLTRDNEARVLAAERDGRPVVDAWPIRMVFEFTGACNLSCFMCGCEMMRDQLRARDVREFTLPVGTFRLIADKAFPHVTFVNPTLSGEPFVLPYWDELIAAVTKYHCMLDLTTNGMLLRGERLRQLLPHLGHLTISFDGATKETFEYVRTGARFEQVMDNLASLAVLRREHGLQRIPVTFNVTLLRENVAELPRIVEIAAAHDIRLITAAFMVVFDPKLLASSPLNCPEITNRALREARARGRELGVEMRLPAELPANAMALLRVEGAEIPPPPPVAEPAADTRSAPSESTAAPAALVPPVQVPAPEPPAPSDRTEGHVMSAERPPGWKGRYFCNFAWRTTFVDQEGSVSPCCAAGRPVLGNAYEQDFFEIWNGPEYQRLRQGLFTGNLTSYCRTCNFLQETGELDFNADSYLQV